jgi:multiple sugar transport system ATP-binding protein
MKVTVDVTEELGSEANVIFTVDAPPAQHESQQLKLAKELSQEHAEVQTRTVGEGQRLWTARVSPRTSARPGRQLELAVDNTELYFFDPDSGDAIARPGNVQDATPPGLSPECTDAVLEVM